MNTTEHTQAIFGRTLLNKVPEVTLFFWVIKVLCTTVGETAADFLNVNLNFGLTGTSVITGILLLIALILQFRSQKYIPSIYWSAVVLISVFGTLITDNLTDSIGVPLEASTLFFSIALGLTFLWWYSKEKTLSIHSIVTRRRELFYWLTILFTFALGTASGDLMAEGLGLGYLLTGVIVAVAIALLFTVWRFGLNPILSFWIIYILTRPLGASIGDFLSQPQKYGGLGLGATLTSMLFLIAILGTVIYLSLTKKDVITKVSLREEREQERSAHSTLTQVIATLSVILVIAGAGYYWRALTLNDLATESDLITPTVEQSVQENTTPSSSPRTTLATTLHTKPKATTSSSEKTVTGTSASIPPAHTSPLGDVSAFRTITQDTLALVQKGDLNGANARVDDLEYEWDTAEARLKPKNKAKWTEVDDAIDAVLRQLRAVHPDASTCKIALNALLSTLQ